MIEITVEYLRSQGLSETLQYRFFEKVSMDDGPTPAHCPELGPCRLWVGSKNAAGYGRLFAGMNGKKQRILLAHVVSWLLHCGPIPPETPCVLHRCDNPPCWRPEHLKLGTQQDNMEDMRHKMRGHQVRCPIGEQHPRHVLNYDAAATIRLAYGTGLISQYALARAFGVNQQVIWSIVHNEIWIKET